MEEPFRAFPSWFIRPLRPAADVLRDALGAGLLLIRDIIAHVATDCDPRHGLNNSGRRLVSGLRAGRGRFSARLAIANSAPQPEAPEPLAQGS